MRYLLFIVLLVAVILTAGCIGENKNPVTPDQTTTQNPRYATITQTSTTITPRVQTVSTIPVISTSGNLKPGQVQCGGYQCPPNWFCCNNICYDPKEGNTGFCCGNKVCPGEWRCRQTKTGFTCSDNTYLHSSEMSEICKEKFPGSFYSWIEVPADNPFNSYTSMCIYGRAQNNSCDKYPRSCNLFSEWCVVPGLYPYPEYNMVIDNEYQAHNIVIDNEYCNQMYPGTHYNSSTETCMYFYNESSCPYEYTGFRCAFEPSPPYQEHKRQGAECNPVAVLHNV